MVVQQFYPFNVGKLTAAEFLDAYWIQIRKLRRWQVGQYDENAEVIEHQKMFERLYRS